MRFFEYLHDLMGAASCGVAFKRFGNWPRAFAGGRFFSCTISNTFNSMQNKLLVVIVASIIVVLSRAFA